MYHLACRGLWRIEWTNQKQKEMDDDTETGVIQGL